MSESFGAGVRAGRVKPRQTLGGDRCPYLRSACSDASTLKCFVLGALVLVGVVAVTLSVAPRCQELAELRKNKLEWCDIQPTDDDMMHWTAMLVGPVREALRWREGGGRGGSGWRCGR